jgi:putative MFS transporter
MLLMLLLPAALFDSYDGELRAVLLHQIQQNFHVGVATLGLINIPIGAGQFVAFFVVASADRFGRRPILLWSIIGYTAFTSLTACSWDIWSFAVFQFGAQVFVGAEFGVAVTLLSEEVPPEQRGRILARLLMFSPIGAILAGGLLAAGLLHNPIGWRMFFLVATIPLVIASVARRRVRESRVYLAEQANARTRPARRREPVGVRVRRVLAIWSSPARGRLAAVCAIAFFQGLPAAAAVGWWTYYAEHERHLSNGLAGTFFAAAAAVSIGGYVVCGRLMDRIGRRPTAMLYAGLAGAFAIGAFQVGSHVWMLVLLLGTAWFGVGVAPVLSAMAAELFPTEVRAEASAWIRNIVGNTGSVAGPALVGVLGAAGGLAGSVGNAASLLALCVVPVVVIVWTAIPETRGESLDAVR